MSSSPSEYGGSPGMIQPDISRVPAEAARVGLGHDSTAERAADREAVGEAAMVVRRAGLKEARGVPGALLFDEEGNRTVFPYDEIRAREDYITGNND